MKKEILIYTDGSSGNKVGKDGGIGCIIMYKDKFKIIQKCYSNTSNNRMEVRAVIESLKCLQLFHIPVVVHSDSQYVVHAFNHKWIEEWKIRNFVGVKNEDLWRELIGLVRKFKVVKFVWVKGHSDNELNNLCDELATNAKNLGKNKIRDL